jgi:hypothetical protein
VQQTNRCTVCQEGDKQDSSKEEQKPGKHKHHLWDTVPHSPPSKLVDLDSSSGLYHDIPLKNSLKEMSEYYNVCKEYLDKENTISKLHCGTKLEKFRRHNFN